MVVFLQRRATHLHVFQSLYLFKSESFMQF